MCSYNWNWPILLKDPYFTWIVTGFGNTILIAVLAWAIAFPLGSAIGIARTADNRALRLAGTVCSESRSPEGDPHAGYHRAPSGRNHA